jgi:hypothetical protein
MKQPGLVAVIVTVDPGESTGYSVVEVYNAKHPQIPAGTYGHAIFARCRVRPLAYGTVGYDQASDVLDQHITYAAALAADREVPLRVVVEKFVITRTAMQTNSTWSSEVTGMAVTSLHRAAPTAKIDTTQQPTEIKNLIHKNRILQQIGLKPHGSGMTTHEADALAHALLFAARLSNGLTRL